MDNQAKIAELKKSINNKFFPEALKPKLKLQIEALQKEIDAENNKAKPKPKQSTKRNVIDYDKMSDEDFAFTLLGKICAADTKAWNETKANSGSEIRQSEKLTKIYANSLDKSLKDLKVKKNSLTEKEYDYLVDNNYHLLNEFLSWNDFYENDFAKSQKKMYQRLFDDKSKSSSSANPDWITISTKSVDKTSSNSFKEKVENLVAKKQGDVLTQEEYKKVKELIESNNDDLIFKKNIDDKLDEYLHDIFADGEDFSEAKAKEIQKELDEMGYDVDIIDLSIGTRLLDPDGVNSWELYNLRKKESNNKSTTKILPKSIEILWAEGTVSEYDNFPKEYPSFEAANKALIPVYKNVYKNTDENDENAGYNKVAFKIVWTDGEEYQGRLDVGKYENPTQTENIIGDHIIDFLKESIAKPLKYDITPTSEYQKLLDNYMFSGPIAKSNTEKTTASKPKKTTGSRKVKSKLKKYFPHRDIKTVTVIEDGKKVVYPGSEVLNGAQFLAKGGKLENLATYVPVRNIVEVELTDGSKVKPANGYHIKNGAKPIMEKGGQTQSEWVVVKPNGYYSLNASGGEGRFLPSLAMAYTYSEEEAKKLAEHLQKTQTVSIKAVPYGTPLEDDPYDKYADGGKTESNEDFDFIKFLDDVQPNVAKVLKEKGIEIDKFYKISLNNIKLIPTILYSSLENNEDKLIIGYYDKNDILYGEIGTIEFELPEKEFHIRFPGLKINEVEMYAKGGWTTDYKYLNKSEDYEVRYAKGKNRKSYAEKGLKTATFDYKNSYSPLNITNSNNVKDFFKYLVNVEKVNFHPDDDFDDYINFETKKKTFTKKQAENLNRYMEDCFIVMDLPKNKDKEIYDVAIEVLKENKALGGDVELPAGSFEQYMIYREKGGKVPIGRLAKGKTLEDIASMHNVSVYEIEKQMEIGEKIEMEHTTDVNVARAIAKDHIFENPNYYTLLNKVEKSEKLKPNDKIIKLTISQKNDLSKQLIEHTGDEWSQDKFENIEPTENGYVLTDRVFRHKNSGKKFIVVKSYFPKTQNSKTTRKNAPGAGSPIFALAKKIRTEGMSWKEAREEAKKQLSKQK